MNAGTYERAKRVARYSYHSVSSSPLLLSRKRRTLSGVSPRHEVIYFALGFGYGALGSVINYGNNNC
uniref:Uncharacterized protein n=1 Tax=Oryza sativa subsp. japonica TaxID=39947 RepID=Q6ERR6_ORYSJ|nr:hypothetical protein [Oryza sativa Japonica Group]